MNLVVGTLIVIVATATPSPPCFWSAGEPRKGAISATVIAPQVSSVCLPPASHYSWAS
jgi:hypothetical protein